MAERVGEEVSSHDRWTDLVRLGVLLLLAVALRTWVIRHTEVGARDSIGFIRYAVQLDEKPWGQVVASFEQHPGYPVLIWVVSQPVRHFAGGVNCDSMLLSAQIASLLASLLTIFPIYFLGKSLFNRDAGFLAAALWQFLPVCLLVTSDGLSEATFLMFVSWSLYFAVLGFRRPAAWPFALCGLGGGLAYLTRPEGGEVVVATGIVLAAFGLLAWGWKQTGFRLAALAAGAIPCVALYVGITGHLTNKPTGRGVLQSGPPEAIPAPADHAQGGSPILLAAFWSPELDAGQSRSLWALKTLVWETAKSAHYFGPVLAVLGLWWFREQWRRDPAMWVLFVLGGMHALLLWRMAVVIGYLSERHALTLILIGVLWAGAAIPMLGRKLAVFSPSLAKWAPATLLLAFMLSGLPPALKPLHANRAGHHAAGRWLASHGSDADEVVDPFCWAHFYAGCVFREEKVVPPPGHTCYVVLEQTGNPHGRLALLPLAAEMARHGERVYHWPEKQPPEKAAVVIYRVPPGK